MSGWFNLEFYNLHSLYFPNKKRLFTKIPHIFSNKMETKASGRLHFANCKWGWESGRSSFTSKIRAAKRPNQWRPPPADTSKTFPTVSPQPFASPFFLSLLFSLPPSLHPSIKDDSSSLPLHSLHNSLLLPPLLVPITPL